VTEQDTTVLAERLHRLADEQAPRIDVVGQVRTARERSRRRRRSRIAILAVATATTAVVLGTATVTGLLATDGDGEVARPTPPATSSSPAAPTTSAAPVTEPAGPFDGWESRTFEGITFAVPPGSRTADTVEQPAELSWLDGPTLTWHGPVLSGGLSANVQVELLETFEGGLTPVDGGAWFTIPGADSAYGGIESPTVDDGTGTQVTTTSVWMYVLDGDRQFRVGADFAGDATGRQMADYLVASLAVTSPDGDPEPVDGPSVVPPGWAARTHEGVHFAVPTGERMPDFRSEPGPGVRTYVWNGPDHGDWHSHITLMVHDRADVPDLSVGGAGEVPITVPGADEAYLSYDRSATAVHGAFAVLVDLRAGDRLIYLTAGFPADHDGERMARNLVASLAVG
jgi:hypothetical protein